MKAIVRISLLFGVCATVIIQGCNSESKKLPENTVKQHETTTDNLRISEKEVCAEIKTTLNVFISSLANKDAEKLIPLISEQGLIVIRNFVSGGNGTRGKDIRERYCRNKIPNDLTFPVHSEIPIEVPVLFPATLKSDLANIPIHQYQSHLFDLKDKCTKKEANPGVSDFLSLVDSILITTKASYEHPMIVSLGSKEAVLFEAAYIAGFSTGTFALFEKFQGTYYLRAIMDLR
jgi:hypothetical protein